MHSVLKSACALGAVVIATAGFAVSAHATTAVSGAVNQVANATVGSVTNTNTNNQAWAAVPTTLGGFVSATASNPLTGDTATVSGLESATWASADAGSVTFTRYGWSLNNNSTPGTEADLIQGRGGPDWTYTFTATSNGTLTMKYNTTLDSGNGFGLWGWSIDVNGNSLFLVNNPSDPTASGSVSEALVAGQTYTVNLNGNPNIGSNGGLVQDGYMNGQFDWSITGAVPEPGTWALILLGVGFMGASLRSRRKLAAA
jgi:hypothetical protein